MAKFTIKAGEEYELKLSRLATDAEEIAKRAIYEGARIVADKVRSNLAGLPTDKFRFLRGSDKLNGLTSQEKSDLLAGLGITPMAMDGGGNWNAKIGFDGYGSMPTKRTQRAFPISLLRARWRAARALDARDRSFDQRLLKRGRRQRQQWRVLLRKKSKK